MRASLILNYSTPLTHPFFARLDGSQVNRPTRMGWSVAGVGLVENRSRPGIEPATTHDMRGALPLSCPAICWESPTFPAATSDQKVRQKVTIQYITLISRREQRSLDTDQCVIKRRNNYTRQWGASEERLDNSARQGSSDSDANRVGDWKGLPTPAASSEPRASERLGGLEIRLKYCLTNLYRAQRTYLPFTFSRLNPIRSYWNGGNRKRAPLDQIAGDELPGVRNN